MASYRPKIKIDSAGNTKDLPLDAETLQGKNVDYFATKTEVDRIQQGNVDALNNKVSHAQLAELTRLKSTVDNRNVNTKPDDYNGWFDIKGLKTNSAINIPSDNSDYSAVLGLRGWSDSSGGDAHELAFTGNGKIYHRYGATESWNEWEKLVTNKELDGKLGKTETAVKANGIADYGNRNSTINIGWTGPGLTNVSAFAAYQDGTHIKDISVDNTKNVLGINNLATKSEVATADTKAQQAINQINSVNQTVSGKQDKLFSGTNIKTINGQSLLGSGDITINGGGGLKLYYHTFQYSDSQRVYNFHMISPREEHLDTWTTDIMKNIISIHAYNVNGSSTLVNITNVGKTSGLIKKVFFDIVEFTGSSSTALRVTASNGLYQYNVTPL